MRKITFRFIMLLIMLAFISCGNDANIVGSNTVISASIEKNYIEQDIISNNDGSCTYTVDNVVVPDIQYNSIILFMEKLIPEISKSSPIIVEELVISYDLLSIIPRNIGIVNIDDYVIRETKYLNLYYPNTSDPIPGRPVSENSFQGNYIVIEFPVVSSQVLSTFSSLYLAGLTNINDTYRVNVKIKLRDLYTNQPLETEVGFNLTFKNILTEGECQQNQIGL